MRTSYTLTVTRVSELDPEKKSGGIDETLFFAKSMRIRKMNAEFVHWGIWDEEVLT